MPLQPVDKTKLAAGAYIMVLFNHINNFVEVDCSDY
jgi:hypothetical protein